MSCAAFLADAGINTKLLEASPKLGGRAYSFQDSKTGDTIDNGQHIMMGCYDSTLELIETIGASDKIDIQEYLRVVFIDRKGVEHKLEASSSFYPLNLSKAILRYSALSIKKRFRVLDLFLDLVCIEADDLIDTKVLQWLKNEHQDDAAISALWEILAIGTLNSDIKKASAAVFVNILKKIFFAGNEATKIIIPNVGLSELFNVPASKFIEQNNGQILLSKRVTGIEMEENSIKRVNTTNETYNDFDFVVSALPLYSVEKLAGFPEFEEIAKEMSYSPILSVHIWLKENNFNERFYGIIDSPVHWLFNHDKYITIVTSAADKFVTTPDEEIIESFSRELSNVFPVFSRDLILSYKIIREKRATFIPTAESIKARQNFRLKFENFLLCGDWTEAFLPATIETAVLSGKKAAEYILEQNL